MAVIPNVVTHGLMALDVYNKLEVSQVQAAIKKHPRAYLLGSNGPDILFYYNVFPWQDQVLNKIVADYGGAVHTRHINDFYNVSVDFVRTMNDGNRKEILISYLAGHFQHWALDSLAHPFIFYRGGEIAGKTRYWHFRYESMIDSLMVTYVKQKKMTRLNPIKFVDVSDEERRVIASLYQKILSDVFCIDTEPEVIDEAILSFKKILNFLYDPRNLWTPVIKRAENKMSEPWAFSSHIVNSQLDSHHDILNLRHERWSNPTDLDDTSTESFIDLYNESIDLGIACISAFEEELNSDAPVSFDYLLKGKCYDTGREEGIPMKYFDSIYEFKI